MAFRKKMNRRSDRRRFSRSARKTNSRNMYTRPMRGGIRL